MSTQALSVRKEYHSLDLAKFFCAILIVSAHFASEWASFPTLIDYAFSLYIIAVPFFFCCSGFLFFKKLNALPSKEEKHGYFLRYEKRILIMYGLWSLVYFIHVVYDWIVDGELGFRVFFKYIYGAIAFTSYSTIWFLPALAVGTAITYFLVSKLNTKQITAICVLLYIFCMFGYTYSFAVEGTFVEKIYDLYSKVLYTSRNGIFNGVPLIFMGSVVARKEIKPSTKGFFWFAALAAVSFLFVVFEAFVLKLKFGVSGMDVCVFLVPFTYFFIIALLHIELKPCKAWWWCRKLSLLIFVSQRLFLTALPAFFPKVFFAIYSNDWVGLIAVIAMTLAFSVGFVLLSEKVKFLKRMI